MSKILISGGSGLIGRHISKLLIESNHNVAWLSREGGSWNVDYDKTFSSKNSSRINGNVVLG